MADPTLCAAMSTKKATTLETAKMQSETVAWPEPTSAVTSVRHTPILALRPKYPATLPFARFKDSAAMTSRGGPASGRETAIPSGFRDCGSFNARAQQRRRCSDCGPFVLFFHPTLHAISLACVCGVVRSTVLPSVLCTRCSTGVLSAELKGGNLWGNWLSSWSWGRDNPEGPLPG